MTRTLTGRDVLFWLVLCFAVVIAVNACFIVISVTTFRGEDEQKPYLQGVEYNRTLAERATQARLGWRATIDASRLSTGSVLVSLTLVHRDGTPERHAVLAGELRHPSDETRDLPLQLREVGAGRYEGVVGGVARGGWDVMVATPAQGSQPFEASRRLWLP